MAIEERYLTGVWYDTQATEFNQIGYDDSENEIIFYNLDGEEVERIDEENYAPEVLVQVDENVVENPVEALEQILDDLQADQIPPTGLDMNDYINLKYARKQVEITEK